MKQRALSNNMSDVVNKVRRIVLDEAIKASKAYMKKELVRQRMQELVTEMVTSGEIKSDAELADFWKSVEMSVLALKMIPLSTLK